MFATRKIFGEVSVGGLSRIHIRQLTDGNSKLVEVLKYYGEVAVNGLSRIHIRRLTDENSKPGDF